MRFIQMILMPVAWWNSWKIVSTDEIDAWKEKTMAYHRLEQLYWLNNYGWIIHPLRKFLVSGKPNIEILRAEIDLARDTFYAEYVKELTDLRKERDKYLFESNCLKNAIQILQPPQEKQQ